MSSSTIDVVRKVSSQVMLSTVTRAVVNHVPGVKYVVVAVTVAAGVGIAAYVWGGDIWRRMVSAVTPTPTPVAVPVKTTVANVTSSQDSDTYTKVNTQLAGNPPKPVQNHVVDLEKSKKIEADIATFKQLKSDLESVWKKLNDERQSFNKTYQRDEPYSLRNREFSRMQMRFDTLVSESIPRISKSAGLVSQYYKNGDLEGKKEYDNFHLDDTTFEIQCEANLVMSQDFISQCKDKIAGIQDEFSFNSKNQNVQSPKFGV